MKRSKLPFALAGFHILVLTVVSFAGAQTPSANPGLLLGEALPPGECTLKITVVVAWGRKIVTP